MDLDNCKQFILDVLKQRGACKIELLLQACKSTSNCPKKLKAISVDDMKLFLESQRELFDIKNGKVCYVQFEKKFADLLLSAIQKEESFSLDEAVNLLNDFDTSTLKYFQSHGNAASVDEFLTRNSDTFRIKDKKVFAVATGVLTEKHAKAVKYFVDILSRKGDLSITALSGHLNQAPMEVKSIVKSTNPTVFKEFLIENSYYFQLNNGMVKKRASSINSLQILIEGDESMCKTVDYFVQKLAAKGKQTLQQFVSYVNHEGTPEIIGTIGSKKLGDIEEFLKSHSGVFHLNGNEVSLCHQEANASASPIAVTITKDEPEHQNSQSIRQRFSIDNMLEGVISNGNNPIAYNDGAILDRSPSGDSLCESKQCSSIEDSKAVFIDLFGNKFFLSLYNLLLSLNLKDLSKVEIIWFDVGRRPFVKILIENPTMKFAVHELNDQPLVCDDYLNEFLQKLFCISPTSYGVKGYLHTFRVNVLKNSPIGITMFHQVHYPEIDDAFEETEEKNLRIIYYDHINTYSNYLYSCMRTISANLSQHYHVIIVDFNGKITGYDSTLPAVLGRSRCIKCCSFKSRTVALNEAFAHNPDYIVTNCLDIMDMEVLNLIQHIAKLGSGSRLLVPDSTLPAVLGRSRCIKCCSFKSRTVALNEAFAHNPDYIVTNCLDIMDMEVLNLIQHIAKLGIQVVLPLNKAYKTFIEDQ